MFSLLLTRFKNLIHLTTDHSVALDAQKHPVPQASDLLMAGVYVRVATFPDVHLDRGADKSFYLCRSRTTSCLDWKSVRHRLRAVPTQGSIV